jgi:dynein heavy chain
VYLCINIFRRTATGKTETIKQLSKAIATRCYVLNCSEKLDYIVLGKFLSGLVQSGAFGTFDDCNGIPTELLSVIAQQLLTIRNAQLFQMRR